MTVYEELVLASQEGKKVRVDFLTKTAWINGKKVVDNGVYKDELGVSLNNVKETTEQLFNNFFFSYPSEKGRNSHSYFIACEFEKLTNEQLSKNEDRVIAKTRLEAYILGLLLLKCPFSVFDTNEKHWFWQSQINKNLILQRSWFYEKGC